MKQFFKFTCVVLCELQALRNTAGIDIIIYSKEANKGIPFDNQRNFFTEVWRIKQ